MSSKVAVGVNILIKTFVVLKRPELNGSLDSDHATTGTSHEFRGPRKTLNKMCEVIWEMTQADALIGNLLSSMEGRSRACPCALAVYVVILSSVLVYSCDL